VCGCSGLYYWNDCVREQHGDATGATDGGACSTPHTCSSSTDCPPGAFCGKARCPSPDDPRSPIGLCYFLPEECPTSTLLAIPDGGPAIVVGIGINVLTCDTQECVDYCAAVRKGTQVHFSGPFSGQACP
jgi:hypothetical protein